MKKLMTAIALAMLAATPAFAATHHARVSAQQPYAGDDSASGAYAAASSGLAVYSFGRYAGWDPDPAIRFQLMRDPNLAD